MFAHLVVALVFKTSGGFEQSSQWVRFPYTPAIFCPFRDRINREGERKAAKSGSRMRDGQMKLSAQQESAIYEGQAVEVIVAEAPCVLLRKDIYEKSGAVDYGPWTEEEIDLLAAETADLLKGDGLDEQDDS